MKVSIRNYTRTTTPSVHLEIDHFFYHGYVYRILYRMFCISIYNEGINNKLHLHYKTKSTSFFIMVIYTGFLYVLYFNIQ